MIRLVSWFAAFAMSVTAVPALAATSTMVQFGAFETRAEAEARLADVKQKHAGLVGSLTSSIREVPVGSEGLTTYRTQAGPVANKAAAQSICAQMASNGDECYVVESAMAQPAATPAASTTAASMPASTSNYGGAERALGTPPQSLAANTHAAAPDIKLPPVPAAVPVANAAPVAATLPNNVAIVPARDPRNMAALASVSENPDNLNPPSAPRAPAVTDGTAPSPAMQAAMDQAIANEASAASAVAVKPAPQKTILERLNPFASDTSPKPQPALAAAPVAPAVPMPPAPTALPSPALIETPPAPALKPATVKLASTNMAAPVASAAPKVVSPVVETPQAPLVALAPTPAAPAPLLLPPPPAPLRGTSAPQAPAYPVAPAPVYAVPPSSAMAPAPGMRMPEQTGINVPPPPMIASIPGPNVQVEEAKRVPLTQGNAAVVPPNAVLSLSPSATLGQRTIWAQIGPFTDAQDALAFWDHYRLTHPDFPVVRVRVTNAVSAVNRGDTRQWLRVGPFARDGFVSALCASLLDVNGRPIRDGMQCGRVLDMGVASSGDRIPGYLPGSRYKR